MIINKQRYKLFCIGAMLIPILLFSSCASDLEEDVVSADSGSVSIVADDSGSSELLADAEDAARDSTYYSDYDENYKDMRLVFSDGEYVYANGIKGIYRIQRDKESAAELIFTPSSDSESCLINDFVVYENAIYFELYETESLAEGAVKASFCRYDIISNTMTTLEEEISIGLSSRISIRQNFIYRHILEPNPNWGVSIAEIGARLEVPQYRDEVYEIDAEGSVLKLDVDPNLMHERLYFMERLNEAVGTLVSENADGTDEIELATTIYGNYHVAHNKIFYLDYASQGVVALFSVNPDGTGTKVLSENNLEWDSLFSDVNWNYTFMTYANHDEKYLYIQGTSNFPDPEDIFFRMDYDGTERVDYPELRFDDSKLELRHGYGIEIMGDWMYFLSFYNGDTSLFRMKSDGTGTLQMEPF